MSSWPMAILLKLATHSHLYRRRRSKRPIGDVSLDNLPVGLVWLLDYNPTTVTLQIGASTTSGDYDHDGFVDAAYYIVWRESLGQNGTSLAADGNGNNQVTVDDYSIWKANFGEFLGSGSGSASSGVVPEPSAVWLVLEMIAICFCQLRGGMRRGRFRF